MTRPIDPHGVEHRPSCDLPEPTVRPSTLSGWNLIRCPKCGAQRLSRRATMTAGTSRTER